MSNPKSDADQSNITYYPEMPRDSLPPPEYRQQLDTLYGLVRSGHGVLFVAGNFDGLLDVVVSMSSSPATQITDLRPSRRQLSDRQAEASATAILGSDARRLYGAFVGLVEQCWPLIALSHKAGTAAWAMIRLLTDRIASGANLENESDDIADALLDLLVAPMPANHTRIVLLDGTSSDIGTTIAVRLIHQIAMESDPPSLVALIGIEGTSDELSNAIEVLPDPSEVAFVVSDLTGRGLAQITEIPSLNRLRIRSWVGSVDPVLSDRIIRLSEGKDDAALNLVNSWILGGFIGRSNGVLQIVDPGREPIENSIRKALAQFAIADGPKVKSMLIIAAIQGPRFSVALTIDSAQSVWPQAERADLESLLFELIDSSEFLERANDDETGDSCRFVSSNYSVAVTHLYSSDIEKWKSRLLDRLLLVSDKSQNWSLIIRIAEPEHQEIGRTFAAVKRASDLRTAIRSDGSARYALLTRSPDSSLKAEHLSVLCQNLRRSDLPTALRAGAHAYRLARSLGIGGVPLLNISARYATALLLDNQFEASVPIWLDIHRRALRIVWSQRHQNELPDTEASIEYVYLLGLTQYERALMCSDDDRRKGRLLYQAERHFVALRANDGPMNPIHTQALIDCRIARVDHFLVVDNPLLARKCAGLALRALYESKTTTGSTALPASDLQGDGAVIASRKSAAGTDWFTIMEVARWIANHGAQVDSQSRFQNVLNQLMRVAHIEHEDLIADELRALRLGNLVPKLNRSDGAIGLPGLRAALEAGSSIPDSERRESYSEIPLAAVHALAVQLWHEGHDGPSNCRTLMIDLYQVGVKMNDVNPRRAIDLLTLSSWIESTLLIRGDPTPKDLLSLAQTGHNIAYCFFLLEDWQVALSTSLASEKQLVSALEEPDLKEMAIRWLAPVLHVGHRAAEKLGLQEESEAMKQREKTIKDG